MINSQDGGRTAPVRQPGGVAIGPQKRSVVSMTVEAIKEAIEHLPDEEKTALAAWIIEQDMNAWDKQIEQDFSPGGAGMPLLEQVKADIRAGKFKPFEEGRPPRR